MISLAATPPSLRTQLSLTGLSNQAWYYDPIPETALNLELMRRIDEQYLRTPFYGVPRMHQYLLRLGYPISYNRVERLYRIMGMVAIYPKKKLSLPGEGHKIYPYLLRGMEIIRPNQVWCADITYVPMERGFMYLVAIMDWYSRYVLAWELSNSMESSFCVEALRRALSKSQPEIFNTDQGSQFTSEGFTSVLLGNDIRVSMDGKGRFTDNIFIERLWRSVKYEHIYLHAHTDGQSLWKGLNGYFNLHNHEKPHQGLLYALPSEVYYG
jgi:putative transposase